MYGTILKTPVPTVIILLIITSWFGWEARTFQEQIQDDVEVYLPEGAESTELLLQVREQWSTDVALIYVQTNNVLQGDPSPETNITNEKILKELSWVEGDDSNGGSIGVQRGIDPIKGDRGKQDGVLWIISIAQIIKEANSSDGRFMEAACLHGIEERISLTGTCSQVESGPWGEYNIPDQNRIDQIVEQLSGSLSNLAIDTNDDGIWDTTFILVGLNHNMSETKIWDGFEEFHVHIEEVMDARGTKETKMTLTGVTKILEDVSDEIYEDLKGMMPLSILFVIIIITLLHRSWKIVIITGLPILMALCVTFGSTVIFDMTLTPMIIAAGPILVGLGVDYSLHIINRIEESRNRIIDEVSERNYNARISGKSEENLPESWDIGLYKEATMESISTTGKAVLLSAVTTVIGFSVLAEPNLVPIIPMRTVGITLVLGITITLILSTILVPVLGWILKFKKRSNPPVWNKVGHVPIKYHYVIIAVVLIFTSWGIYYMQDELGKPITGSSEVPEGITSMEVIVEYSEQFDSGQTSMFILDASERGATNGTTAIRDIPVLDAIESMENSVGNVSNTSTTSIVTFLKSIHISLNESGIEAYDDSLWNILHHPCWTWDYNSEIIPPITSDPIQEPHKAAAEIAFCEGLVINEATNPGSRAILRGDFVDVTLDTLSLEVRSMLFNEPEDKTLVYVEQPYLNLIYAGGLRDQIDSILKEGPEVEGVDTSKLAGGLPVSLDVNKGVHDAQSSTTIVTLFVLIGVLMIIFRSFRLGIFTMLPVAVVVLWQPLLMKSGDVNVNLFTAMVGTIVFGIGVDDCIHMMERIREEGETAVGISRSIERTGQTIFETSITTMSGLAAGLFLAFPGLTNFFSLMIMLIGFAFLTSVFFLPASLTSWYVIKHLLTGKGRWDDLEGGPSLDEGQALKAVLID